MNFLRIKFNIKCFLLFTFLLIFDFACGVDEEQDLRMQDYDLYQSYNALLKQEDCTSALFDINKLISNYPYSEYVYQAYMDKMFCSYYTADYDEAFISSTEFINRYPMDKHIDYALYIRANANFSKYYSIGLFSYFVDNSSKDISYFDNTFADLKLLIDLRPDSIYVSSAYYIIKNIINNFALSNYSTAYVYFKKKAYLAAANRLTENVKQYNEHKDTLKKSLLLLHDSYLKLDQKTLAEKTKILYEANFGKM